MVVCRLDHIIITAHSLEAGGEWAGEQLGVKPQTGGAHPCMGTHNFLLRLGEAMYLEIIAINPDAARPTRPRWFGLDSLAPEARPCLAGWVARTDDIQQSASIASEVLGQVESMSRGALEWLISIPEDGSLPLSGVAPSLIQWQTTPHPASKMQDMGCELVALELRYPEPQRVEKLLSHLQIDEPGVALTTAKAVTPRLVAHVRTPGGIRTLGA